MDSPVRKMQKRNDYNRHKLFRKIRRRRRAQAELLSRIAEKELKKKLRVTPVKYGDGKVDNTQNYIGPFRPLSYAQEFSDTLKESVQKASNHLKQNQAINTAKKLSKRHVSTVLHIGGNAEQVREKFWKQEPVLDHAVDSIANEYGINPEILKYRINKEGFVDRAVRLNNTAAGSEYKYSDPGGYSLLHSPIFTGPGDFGLDDYAYYVENGVRPINENWETVDFVNEKKRRTAAATGETVADNMGMVASLLRYFAQQAKHDYPSLSDYDLNRYALAYYNRGQAGGRKWAENGAKGYEFRPKGFMLMPQYAYKGGKTTGYVREKNNNPVAFDEEGNLIDQVTGEKGIMNIPEVTISPSRYTRDLYSSAFEGNQDKLMDMVSLAPIAGDVIDAYEVYNDLNKGNYLAAGIGAGMLALPNFIEKPVRGIGKIIRKAVRGGGVNTFYKNAKANRGFAVSSPRMGKIFGKDIGLFTVWIPADRPWSKGLSWINTGAPTTEGLPVQYITSKHPGEARKLYDAVIKKSIKEGHPGIITGRSLISAPKTYSTLEHYYPSRVKLDDMGHWSNDNMTGLFEGPKKMVYTLDDFLKTVSENPTERVHFLGAPRYRLEIPSTAEITAENATSMTPKQWTAAQDAAIARGDMTEAQRLRDLHFKTSAPDTKTLEKLYHGTYDDWNVYDDSYFGSTTDNGVYGRGLYLTRYKNIANNYGDKTKEFYANIKKPFVVSDDEFGLHGRLSASFLFNRPYDFLLPNGKTPRPIKSGTTYIQRNDYDHSILDELSASDAVIHNSHAMPVDEVVIGNGEVIKSADAITYDDKGVRIPLGLRDNFNINDTRYGLVPLGIGLTGYGVYNNSEYKNGKTASGIHIKPSHRGRLTQLKKRTGKSEAELYRTGSAATRKMITFARNARKWNK